MNKINNKNPNEIIESESEEIIYIDIEEALNKKLPDLSEINIHNVFKSNNREFKFIINDTFFKKWIKLYEEETYCTILKLLNYFTFDYFSNIQIGKLILKRLPTGLTLHKWIQLMLFECGYSFEFIYNKRKITILCSIVHLQNFLDVKTQHLSSGCINLTFILMSLITSPDLLIWINPEYYLDYEMKQEIYNLLKAPCIIYKDNNFANKHIFN